MTALVMGHNDSALCREGWYALERDGRNGVAYRWTIYPEGIFEMDLVTETHELTFFVCGAPAPMQVATQTVEVCRADTGATIGTLTIVGDTWQVVKCPLSTALPAGRARLVLRVADGLEYVPDRYLRNGDRRHCGVRVGAVRTN